MIYLHKCIIYQVWVWCQNRAITNREVMDFWQQVSCCVILPAHSATWCHMNEQHCSPSSFNFCMSIITLSPRRAFTSIRCFSRGLVKHRQKLDFFLTFCPFHISPLVPTVLCFYSQAVSCVRNVSYSLIQELQSTFPVRFINVDLEQQTVNGCSQGQVLFIYSQRHIHPE